MRPPQLSVVDPESRFSVGIGPGLELTLQAYLPLGRRGATFAMVFQTGIEAPKLETRFVGKSGLLRAIMHPEDYEYQTNHVQV